MTTIRSARLLHFLLWNNLLLGLSSSNDHQSGVLLSSVGSGSSLSPFPTTSSPIINVMTTSDSGAMTIDSAPSNYDSNENPLKFDDIVDRKTYDKMRPPKPGGKPTKVSFHVTVMSLDSINEGSMTYAADIFFGQEWNDHRLKLPANMTQEYRLLPVEWLQDIWRPDSFFKNAKQVTFQRMTIPNHYLWLYKNKQIMYMVKLTLLLSCAMKFHKYPHDEQTCRLSMESISHTTDDLVFEWLPEENIPLVVDDGIELPQLELILNYTADCTAVYSTGNFTCLEVVFKFRRRLGYFMFHTYIPTCLIVMMSWISFWIKPEAVPARVTLGVTSLLTLSTQHANSQKSLPPVSYIKAIDMFMSSCTFFVFLSLIEYAFVNVMMGDISEIERKDRGHPPRGNFPHNKIFKTVTNCSNSQDPVTAALYRNIQLLPTSNNFNHNATLDVNSLANNTTSVGSHSGHMVTTPLLTNTNNTQDNSDKQALIVSSGPPVAPLVAGPHHHHHLHHLHQVPAHITHPSQLQQLPTPPPPPSSMTGGGTELPLLPPPQVTAGEANNAGLNTATSTSCPRHSQPPNETTSLRPPTEMTNFRQLLGMETNNGIVQKPKAKDSKEIMKKRREKAICIDRVSRVLFPSTFVLLNIIYWLVFSDIIGSLKVGIDDV